MYNLDKRVYPWNNRGESMNEPSLVFIHSLDFYGGAGRGDQSADENKNADEDSASKVDKSVMDKMNARRGPGDSTKADSGGGDADKRVVSRDVDTGPVNTYRGA